VVNVCPCGVGFTPPKHRQQSHCSWQCYKRYRPAGHVVTKKWGARRRQKLETAAADHVHPGTRWLQVSFQGPCACGAFNWLYAPEGNPEHVMCGTCAIRLVRGSVPETRSA